MILLIIANEKYWFFKGPIANILHVLLTNLLLHAGIYRII